MKPMRHLKLALLLMATAAASVSAIAAPPGQRYRLVGVHDAASELILYPDGRFEYALAYGALDEEAKGRWTRSGNTIRLTTVPKPRPAVFSAGPSGRTTDAPLTIKVVLPNGRGLALVDFVITFDTGPPISGYTQDDGWTLDPAEKRTPRSITLGIPMYELKSQVFAIEAAKGNQLTFVLTPNDLGTIDFENLPLTMGANRLIMHRGGADLTYVTEKN
jgi:hypothetical protein